MNDLLDTIFTNKTLASKYQEDKILMSLENDNENENDKTLMSSNEDDDDDDETMSQKEQNINGYLNEIIGKSKSFEDG